ncbi:MAG: hypothetical protein ACRC10_11940 [Thermoguttaceae bacterium]
MRFPLFVLFLTVFMLPLDAAETPQGDEGVDSMRYLENDRIKLGIDLSIGGAVTFLTDRENGGENMINSADWGRQIQLSYYSGPHPFIGPNGEEPTKHWAGLGWNPIQSGDAGGNRSKTIAFERPSPNSMLVRCIPMNWPHTKGVCGDCEFQVLYTLDENVFNIQATIVVNRPDKTQYAAHGQEMPALYTNGAWYKLVTYLGTKPFENEPITVLVDKNDGKGWPWINYYTPERWSALVNEKGLGIGVYQADDVRTTAGFHGGDAKKGFGNAKSAQTGYIAPLGREILDHNIVLTYETTFILGTVEEIRNYVKERERNRTLPNWVFQNNRQSWSYQNGAFDSGWPIRESLAITFPANGQLQGPETFWQAEDAPFLEIEADFIVPKRANTVQEGANGIKEGANGTNEVNEGQKEETTDAAKGQVDFLVTIQPFSPSDCIDWLGWSEGTQDAAKEREEKGPKYPTIPAFEVPVSFAQRGKDEVYRIDLSQHPQYKGAMKSMTIQVMQPCSATVKAIRLRESK